MKLTQGIDRTSGKYFGVFIDDEKGVRLEIPFSLYCSVAAYLIAASYNEPLEPLQLDPR